MKKLLLIFSVALYMGACTPTAEESSDSLSIEFEKYTLENGLDVVLHQDKSDPIVSVAIMYHVGSNREKPGRTGFAHLFEHILFQESENVPQDQFFKKIQDAGGTLNGGTWQDGTVYYEVVPKNALEMVMWLESDRMGYLINTVTESAFANQQEVVQNEKRQRVDNNPYGHTSYVIDKNIYPEGHPYNWQVIGELVDLQNATVDDVKEFYGKFYGANNATLVIAGDFENEETKELVEKYFGELKSGPEVAPLKTQLTKLEATKRVYHEDNFARSAQLNMVWPTVEQYNQDAYALDFLAELLSEGKKAPMYKVLIKEKNLTSRINAWNRALEVAGVFRVLITANDGISLDSVEQAVFESFAKFEADGITDKDVERIKVRLETQFYNGISGVLDKSFQLSQYNVFAGDPKFIEQDIANTKAVTKEDIVNAYNKYIKDMPYVITSFVPKGKLDLIASNSEKANVVEEKITENVEKVVEESTEEIAKTPSNFDRSVEPVKGPTPESIVPAQWTASLENGMNVYGIQQNELPLVQISLVIKGGHYLDDINKNGVANLMTDIMMEGTATKTPEELEEAIDLLGANINMFTSNQNITVTGNCLARNYDATMALIEEILLQPRWDEEEFELIKTRTINQIKRSAGQPNVVARSAYNRLLYGNDHILGFDAMGSEKDVEALSIEDLKNFYDKNFSPSVTNYHVVGSIGQEKVMNTLKSLNTNWAAKEVVMPQYEIPEQSEEANLYFVDMPQSKQSVINIGYMALPRTDKDFYPATVMNYKLGGSFSGNVNLILREEKGYTYGARTGFSGDTETGTFTASSSVRTNTTYESTKIFMEEMENYREGISQEDLDFTKNAMIKSNTRRFETLGSLIGMLQSRSNYGWSADYVKQNEATVNNMTLEQHKELAQKYVTPNKMSYVIVGDAATQFEQFKDAGFNKVMLIDKDANEIKIPVTVDVNK